MSRLTTLILAMLFVVSVPAHADWNAGVAAFRAGDYDRAVREFQALVGQSPEQFQGHYMLGLSLARLDRTEQALHHLRKAYDLNPNDLSVKLALGHAYNAAGRFQEVARLLGSMDSASIPARQQASFYQLRGMARRRVGDARGALSDIEQLARLQPTDLNTQQVLASLADQLGQADTALAASATAARLAPQDPDTQRAYVQMLIKTARLMRDEAAKQHRYRQGADAAVALVALSPTYEDQMLAAGVQLGAGMWTEAAASSRSAIALNEGGWVAHFYLGQALTSAGRHAEAVAPLEAALDLAPRDGSERAVWGQLGFVHETQGNWPQAIEAYEQAGDQTSIARVRENQTIAQENTGVEAVNERIWQMNERIRQMQEEAQQLEEQLKELEEGGGI
jgi:tetratricopeptide (TPR) repeat protein